MSFSWRSDDAARWTAPERPSPADTDTGTGTGVDLDAAFAELQALLDARTPARELDGELSCCGRPRRCRGCRKPAWGGLGGLHPEYWSTDSI